MLQHARAGQLGQKEIGEQWVIEKRKNVNKTFLRLVFAENSGLVVREEVV